jgi:hypothetical protein
MGYRVSWDVQGARCIYSGDTTMEDVVNALVKVYSLAAFPVFSFIIHDFSASKHIVPGVAATATTASHRLNPGAPNHKLRTAIITTDRAFESLLYSFKFHSRVLFEVFHVMADAQDWARQDCSVY